MAIKFEKKEIKTLYTSSGEEMVLGQIYTFVVNGKNYIGYFIGLTARNDISFESALTNDYMNFRIENIDACYRVKVFEVEDGEN